MKKDSIQDISKTGNQEKDITETTVQDKKPDIEVANPIIPSINVQSTIPPYKDRNLIKT
jgi:hypothetical protein